MHHESDVKMREEERTLILEYDCQGCITNTHYDCEHEQCMQPPKVAIVSKPTRGTEIRRIAGEMIAADKAEPRRLILLD
jgi:succinyl-CoA synthetase alpha subunit